LPPALLALFTARDPIEFIHPVEHRQMPSYTGISNYVQYFNDPKFNDLPPPSTPVLSKEERRAKKRKERLEQEMEKIKEQLKTWDPYVNPKATDDSFKTLFVGRISYKTTEHKLKREFEQYGPIRSVRMVYDLDGKPRGYAFIEYERERDMRTAFKEADAKKIDGRRVLVDVERGRTVKGWKPRRFGGGLGGTRIGERENTRHSGRGPPSRDRERGDRDYRRDDRDRGDGSRERGDRKRREERDGDRERNIRPRTESRHEEQQHRDRGERRDNRDRDRGERERDRGDREKDRERERGDRDRDRDGRGERDRERGDRDERRRSVRGKY